MHLVEFTHISIHKDPVLSPGFRVGVGERFTNDKAVM